MNPLRSRRQTTRQQPQDFAKFRFTLFKAPVSITNHLVRARFDSPSQKRRFTAGRKNKQREIIAGVAAVVRWPRDPA